MIWEPEFECMPREKLDELKVQRLSQVLHRVYDRVPFYKKLFDDAGIKPQDIRSLDDMKYLPFTTKEDIRANYPFGLFAVPMEEIVRLHTSSGTTGNMTVGGYTRNDIETWSNLVARFLTAGGLKKNDIVQIAFGYGLFTGGFGLHYGVEKVGATVIPASSGFTTRQVKFLKDMGTTALVCTPSYALHIAETVEEMGIDNSELKLKWGFFGAEPWNEKMRRSIQQKLNIVATDNYGLSEIIGPGVSGECLERNGLHIFEDNFIPEIIDLFTGKNLPPGELGELVLTSLTKDAFPVIRYRTRDLTSLSYEPCPCGRTMVKMERVYSRCDDMLIIRGVNIFPRQIEEILFRVEGIEPHYQLVIDKIKNLDRLTVLVEVREKIFFDDMKRMHSLEGRLRRELEIELGISVDIKLVEPKTIERSEGKAKRVIDNRVA